MYVKSIKLRIRAKIILCILLCSASTCLKSQKWSLSKEKDGILVYTAESGSSYKMFKAEMIIDANLHGLIYLLKDAHAIPTWMDKVGEFEIFGKTDEFHWYSWSGVDMPWPVDNRDVVSKEVLKKSKNTYVIEISSSPDEIKDRNGYTRLRVSDGFWSFEKLANGKIKVIYQFLTIPEGIPAWVVNLFIVDSPYTTLENMREMVKKEPYKSIELPYLN